MSDIHILDKFLEGIFLGEINLQCKIFLIAYYDLKNHFKNILTTIIENDKRDIWTTRCWSLIQTILLSSANLSKIFNPPKPLPYDESLEFEQKQRGIWLLKKLEISQDSPIFSRDLRNDLEHLDSRFHIWYKTNSNLIHRNIGSKNRITVGNTTAQSYFVNFDPTSFTITFWNHSFSIEEIANEIKNLSVKVNHELQSDYH